MTPVASSSHEYTVRSERVRQMRRLATSSFRDKTGMFLVEGPQAVREAARYATLQDVFVTEKAAADHPDVIDLVGRHHIVAPDVIARIADSSSPQGIVASVHDVIADPAEVLATKPTFVVVCADIQDPGNAGAIIRCADAAGAEAVFFTGNHVDPQNPKAVRASVGSLFHLPVARTRDTAGLLTQLQAAGITILATSGYGNRSLFDIASHDAVAWLMGNEGAGLAEDLIALADEVVSIPLYGAAESLNLATATALCLYETARHRNSGNKV